MPDRFFAMSVRRLINLALLSVVSLLLLVLPILLYLFFSYYRSLESQLVERFSGRRWNIPSRIYSDSLTAYPGQKLSDLGFFERLKRLNYHPVGPPGPRVRGEYRYDAANGDLVIFLHGFRYPFQNFDGALVELRLRRNGTIESIRDLGQGKAIYSIQLEPELLSSIYSGLWEQRRLVRLSELPPLLIDAVLAAEDHRFYAHRGVDLPRIIKAAWVDLTSHKLRQGGSTLTQQLMKNFFLSPKRDWRRKIKEALMAYIAERRFTKDEILENYVNDIYLGQRGQAGVYGLWEASEFYFSKDPRDLTIAEMATLAGMISSPNRLNPLRHPEAAAMRRNEVLRLMLHDGYISEAAYAEAIAEKLRPREVYTEGNDAPYFVDFVKHELAERFPPEVLAGEGLRVFTTLDIHQQKLAEQAVTQGLEQLEKQHSYLVRKETDDRLEACLIALEPQSGKIRAMVGGRNYRDSQFNRVTQSKRQPGSVFKPVTYLAALNETLSGGPQRLFPTTRIDDDPFTWTFGDQSWTPNNYQDRYFGEVTLEFALAESLNAATSRLAYEIGLDRVLAMASKLGFNGLPAYPSVVLGGIEVSPLQIASAYSIIANGGLKVQPFAVTAVVDANNKIIEGHELKAEQVLSPALAYEMIFMLKQVLDHGTGIGARKAGFRRPAGGKTGTTNDLKDAWFAGFTPNLLAVVWAGFDKKEDLGLTGAEAALPIWTAFMSEATAPYPPLDFVPPPDIVLARVDPVAGGLAGPGCVATIAGVFLKGMEPPQTCPPTASEPLLNYEQPTSSSSTPQATTIRPAADGRF
jgi:penicillin-binding protein 1B